MRLEDQEQEEMQEIGIDGYRHYRKTLKFGDIVENGWASIRNPIRFGIVIEVKVKTIRMTDGKDRFWELCFDAQTKLKLYGNITNKTLDDFKGSILLQHNKVGP